MADAESSLILLPIDGSGSSLRAAGHCAKLAKAFRCRVLVLNVQPKIEDWQTHGLGHQAALDHLTSLARQACEPAEKALSEAGVVHETAVEFGEPADVIARIVTERACSSLVMGTRGQGELRSVLVGSVGMKVIHLVRIPITLVH
jgi:nucleotide-binding universal stress UspA family protein